MSTESRSDMDILSNPAFWRIYYGNRLELEDDTEYAGNGEVRGLSANVDRIFGPSDDELYETLFPCIAPPDTFDEADVPRPPASPAISPSSTTDCAIRSFDA